MNADSVNYRWADLTPKNGLPLPGTDEDYCRTQHGLNIPRKPFDSESEQGS